MADSKDVEQNKVLAAVGYLGILFLVPMLAAPKSPYAQFHAKQGMVLFIAAIILSVVLAIPVLGWVIGGLGEVFILILMIMGIINAVNGQEKPLPVIGQFASKVGGSAQ
jgi:uncharacterized membrane protein